MYIHENDTDCKLHGEQNYDIASMDDIINEREIQKQMQCEIHLMTIRVKWKRV